MAWTSVKQCDLQRVAPNNGTQWGVNRAYMAANVAVPPGQIYTYAFTVTAPTAGVYSFQWRMLEEGYEGFGGDSTLLNIQVV